MTITFDDLTIGRRFSGVTADGDVVVVALEIHATSTEGYDDATRRVVSENAKSLGAKGAEFD